MMAASFHQAMGRSAAALRQPGRLLALLPLPLALALPLPLALPLEVQAAAPAKLDPNLYPPPDIFRNLQLAFAGLRPREHRVDL